MLTADQVASYRAHGYVIARDVLDENLIAELQATTAEFIERARSLRASDDVIELEVGDISIHHVRLLHGSGPNLSSKPRRLLLQGYAAVDARPPMANDQPADWPEWNDRILRGNPTVDMRLDGSSVPVPIPRPLQKALGLFDTQAQLSGSHYAAELAEASSG